MCGLALAQCFFERIYPVLLVVPRFLRRLPAVSQPPLLLLPRSKRLLISGHFSPHGNIALILAIPSRLFSSLSLSTPCVTFLGTNVPFATGPKGL